MFIGRSDSPMWKRGWWPFSSSVTCQPCCASRIAAAQPAGPPPITSTSGVSAAGACGVAGEGAGARA